MDAASRRSLAAFINNPAPPPRQQALKRGDVSGGRVHEVTGQEMIQNIKLYYLPDLVIVAIQDQSIFVCQINNAAEKFCMPVCMLPLMATEKVWAVVESEKIAANHELLFEYGNDYFLRLPDYLSYETVCKTNNNVPLCCGQPDGYGVCYVCTQKAATRYIWTGWCGWCLRHS